MAPNVWTARAAIFYVFCTNLDFLIILPLIPQLVGAGASATQITSILGLRVSISLVGSLVMPHLFKGRSTTTILVVSACFKALSFLMLLNPTLSFLYLFSILTGLGSGFLKPAVRTLLAESTAGARQKKYFQFLFIAMNAAFVVGPMISSWIPVDYLRIAFIVLAGVEILAGCLLLFIRKSPVQSGANAPQNLVSLRKIQLNRTLLSACVLSFVAYFAMGLTIATLIVYDRIHPALAEWTSFCLSAEGFALIALQLLVMPFFKKFSEFSMILIAAFALSIGTALPLVGIHIGIVLLGLTLFALSECLILPLTQLLATRGAAADSRLVTFSLISIVATLGEIAGSFWAGWSLDIAADARSLLWLHLATALAILLAVTSAAAMGRVESQEAPCRV